MNIVVVGGENLGHAIAVSMSGACDTIGFLTRDCSGFGNTLEARLPCGNVIHAENVKFSNSPGDLIPHGDMIILTVPSHGILDCLKSIQPFVVDGQLVVSVVASGGFFWIAREVLGEGPGLAAFQRVPFICRVVERGVRVDILGLKVDNICPIRAISTVEISPIRVFPKTSASPHWRSCSFCSSRFQKKDGLNAGFNTGSRDGKADGEGDKGQDKGNGGGKWQDASAAIPGHCNFFR